jgi:hypothetical protein
MRPGFNAKRSGKVSIFKLQHVLKGAFTKCMYIGCNEYRERKYIILVI